MVIIMGKARIGGLLNPATLFSPFSVLCGRQWAKNGNIGVSPVDSYRPRLTIPSALATLRSEPYRYLQGRSKSSATLLQPPPPPRFSPFPPFPFPPTS